MVWGLSKPIWGDMTAAPALLSLPSCWFADPITAIIAPRFFSRLGMPLSLHPDVPAFHHDATACEECDLLIPPAVLQPGEASRCPRCGHTVVRCHSHPRLRPLAYGLATLIMFLLANSFTFMSFSSHGLGREMTFLQTITALVDAGYLFLAVVLSVTLIAFPLVYICSLMLVVWRLDKDLHPSAVRSLGRALCRIRPWLMVDVFLIGVLISLVKLMGMADITMGAGFWAFVGYTLMLIKTISTLDIHWLWHHLFGPVPAVLAEDEERMAREAGLIGCHVCGALGAQGQGRCHRCGSRLHSRKPASLQRTLALLVTASILYIPANLYPIMDTVFLGDVSPSTILGGVVLLWGLGSYPIAAVIFLASVVVPLAKLIALYWLCWQTHSGRIRDPLARLKLYRMTEFVGRWSMIDVFVVAILAGLIRLDNLMTIYPGPAAVSFAGVVIITMIAAMNFDPRLIWDLQEGERDLE